MCKKVCSGTLPPTPPPPAWFFPHRKYEGDTFLMPAHEPQHTRFRGALPAKHYTTTAEAPVQARDQGEVGPDCLLVA
jgi:hypothetical protein